jgi:hypothetical protein
MKNILSQPSPQVKLPRYNTSLLTIHYNRPGFTAWWFVFAISGAVASMRPAGVDGEIHWTVAEYLHYLENDIRRWIVPRFPDG